MSPAHDASEGILAQAVSALHEQRAGIDALEQVVASIPERVRDAEIGRRSTPERVDIELVHGPEQQWELWSAVLVDPPMRPVAVFPDLSHLVSLVLDRVGEEGGAALGAAGMRSRVITRTDQLADVTVRDAVERFAPLGIEVRTLAAPPGFLLAGTGSPAGAGGLAVVPVPWGESVPMSLAVCRDPTVVAAVLALFDDLWERARPLPGTVHDWDAICDLMAQGLSDGAIARTLGLSLRTVRRRIAAAAEEHGASSRFSLGVEWSRRSR